MLRLLKGELLESTKHLKEILNTHNNSNLILYLRNFFSLKSIFIGLTFKDSRRRAYVTNGDLSEILSPDLNKHWKQHYLDDAHIPSGTLFELSQDLAYSLNRNVIIIKCSGAKNQPEDQFDFRVYKKRKNPPKSIKP